MDDHHFGYIEGKKNLVTYYGAQSHVLSKLSNLSSHLPWFNLAWDDKPNCDETTPKRHEKMTQNTHKLFCGSRKSKKPNPPPILWWGHYYNIPSTQLLTNGTCTKWQAKYWEQLRSERPPRKTKSNEGKERKEGCLTTTTTTHMGLIHALWKQWWTPTQVRQHHKDI